MTLRHLIVHAKKKVRVSCSSLGVYPQKETEITRVEWVGFHICVSVKICCHSVAISKWQYLFDTVSAIYIYEYMYIYICMYIYMYMYIYICVYIHVYIYVCRYSVYCNIYIGGNICWYLSVYMYIYVYIMIFRIVTILDSVVMTIIFRHGVRERMRAKRDEESKRMTGVLWLSPIAWK